MKSYVLYDSNFGNTKIIAETIAEELGKDVKAVAVSGFNLKDLEGIKLLIAGSPINGWKPSEKMGKFLESLSKGQLKGTKAAAFDTRITIFFHGDAAKKISNKLEEAGAEIISSPEVFFVKGKEGPLMTGEIEKAKAWANQLKGKI
jgi:flavodoxin